MSYRRYVKTMLVQALRATFDAEYPEPDFRDLKVGIEFPIDAQHYPGIWVTYSDTQKLQRAGVDHKEYVLSDTGAVQEITRWRFGGSVGLTLVAMSSLERDRLFDEVVRVVAFGPQDPATNQFRQFIEDNEFVAANIDFDEIEVTGDNAAPGTPWDTDEIIYETSINLDILGEFIPDQATGDLMPLSKIIVTPTQVDAGIVQQGAPAGSGATDWH